MVKRPSGARLSEHMKCYAQEVGTRYKGSLLWPGICANMSCIKVIGQMRGGGGGGGEPNLGMAIVRTCLLS